MFTGCWACFESIEKCKKQKLPRKKKKELKKFFSGIGRWNWDQWVGPTRCDISDDYKRNKVFFKSGIILKKYHFAFNFIKKYCEASGELVYINDKGKLSWFWEYDSDYGGNSGIMPFCYSEEESGETWSFDEVKNLVRSFQGYPDNFVFPEKLTNDRQLLKYLNSIEFTHEK